MDTMKEMAYLGTEYDDEKPALGFNTEEMQAFNVKTKDALCALEQAVKRNAELARKMANEAEEELRKDG